MSVSGQLTAQVLTWPWIGRRGGCYDHTSESEDYEVLYKFVFDLNFNPQSVTHSNE